MSAACRVRTIALNSATCSPPLPAGGVAVVRGEEADRVVPPVVAQPALDEMRVVHELVDGHQLDGGDPEPGEVVDGCRVSQAGVGAALRLGYVRVPRGEALDVHLVDDRLVELDVRAAGRCPSRRTGCARRTWARRRRCRRRCGNSRRRTCRENRPDPTGRRPRWPWRRDRAAAWPGCTADRGRAPTARAPGSRNAVPVPRPGTKACQTNASISSRGSRRSPPSSSKRQSSTPSAVSENGEKLVPAPS